VKAPKPENCVAVADAVPNGADETVAADANGLKVVALKPLLDDPNRPVENENGFAAATDGCADADDVDCWETASLAAIVPKRGMGHFSQLRADELFDVRQPSHFQVSEAAVTDAAAAGDVATSEEQVSLLEEEDASAEKEVVLAVVVDSVLDATMPAVYEEFASTSGDVTFAWASDPVVAAVEVPVEPRDGTEVELLMVDGATVGAAELLGGNCHMRTVSNRRQALSFFNKHSCHEKK
jgi:hypothetical protein